MKVGQRIIYNNIWSDDWPELQQFDGKEAILIEINQPDEIGTQDAAIEFDDGVQLDVEISELKEIPKQNCKNLADHKIAHEIVWLAYEKAQERRSPIDRINHNVYYDDEQNVMDIFVEYGTFNMPDNLQVLRIKEDCIELVNSYGNPVPFKSKTNEGKLKEAQKWLKKK